MSVARLHVHPVVQVLTDLQWLQRCRYGQQLLLTLVVHGTRAESIQSHLVREVCSILPGTEHFQAGQATSQKKPQAKQLLEAHYSWIAFRIMSLDDAV